MSGFPLHPSRDDFGEDLDPIPALNPKRDIGGQTFNLTWWQVAGAGLMVPRAWVLVSGSGVRVAAAESWNPNQDGTLHPVVARVSAGLYTVTFAASADDETGTPRLIGLQACLVAVQSHALPAPVGGGDVAGGNVATIQTSVGGAATDAPFFAAFW